MYFNAKRSIEVGMLLFQSKSALITSPGVDGAVEQTSLSVTNNLSDGISPVSLQPFVALTVRARKLEL